MRRFFAFSEATTKAAGVAPAQYQAMLAIRAHDGPRAMDVTSLAERLCVKLNSAVELVARIEAAGLIERSRSVRDQRRIELRLTPRGLDLVDRIAAQHLAEHRRNLAELARIVAALGAV
ncbi:MarR family transcriptional regulator [Sphingomonas sp.]|uniref:MarR family transcriptional regulator n=1 Tax=Sphingomonas sp. TaxID=28214 RepID=UPI002E30E4D8|nr:MarR family transcriptional regulator [Sphingomonas sp.]HEX4695242.1 MarR family transcriptional regulator [Sphingomonas sp.]